MATSRRNEPETKAANRSRSVTRLSRVARAVGITVYAWVVWSHVVSRNPDAPAEGIWTAIETMNSREQCEAAAARREQQLGGEWRDRLGYQVLTKYICAPDDQQSTTRPGR